MCNKAGHSHNVCHKQKTGSSCWWVMSVVEQVECSVARPSTLYTTRAVGSWQLQLNALGRPACPSLSLSLSQCALLSSLTAVTSTLRRNAHPLTVTVTWHPHKHTLQYTCRPACHPATYWCHQCYCYCVTQFAGYAVNVGLCKSTEVKLRQL